MDFEKYLKENQPIVYNTFKNAREKNKLSHAYLIKGEASSPLKQCALFLAKSLICTSGETFACNRCDACTRFDNDNYVDFMMLDAKANTLKVADIDALEKLFASTPIEKAGIMIYIINHVENMNRESINALLKFLEEPSDNVYAFLTTENETKVLPTILSRCQHLKMLPPKKDNFLTSEFKSDTSFDDLELLTPLSGDQISFMELLESDSYKIVKPILIDYLEALSHSLKEGYFFLQKEALSQIKTKEQIRLFIDLLAELFNDMMLVRDYHQESKFPSLNNSLNKIASQIKNINVCYKEIMFTRGRIELNVTVSLIIEHIGLSIYKGGFYEHS